MRGPLAGIRVLDLTRLYPGPFATMILADLGADVVKVEDRAAGDYLRDISPGQFEALNRGKRSVSVDLKQPPAVALVARLADRADVLVESFRPGVLDRIGCGPAALLARNPRLVVCSISGYGQSGPYAGRAGHDADYIALAGVLARNGLGAVPVLPGMQVGDFFGGSQQAVIAILAALLERARTGRGRHLDVAMCEGAMSLLLPHFGALAAGEAPQTRGEDVLSGSHPCYRVYACKGGGSVALGALEPKFWERFCLAVSRPDWVPRQLDRELTPFVDELFLDATRDEWVERLSAADCCVEPVLEPVEARAHPQARARGVFLDSGQMRTVPALCDPAAGRAPHRGEHTDEVLREHGFADAEIESLRASGALR